MVDEGVGRSVYFNFYALPVLGHYRAVEFYLRLKGHKRTDTEARAAAFASLHERYAPLSLHVMRRLKGYYIKVCCLAAGPLTAGCAETLNPPVVALHLVFSHP